MRHRHWLVGLCLAVLVSLPAVAIINPDFAPEQSYSGAGDEFPGPEGWILRDLEDRRALVSTVEFAQSGERVFWFESLTRGYGDNKLEQCAPLTDPDDIIVSASVWTLTPDSDLRLRINVEFYASLADCLDREDEIEDSEGNFNIDGPAATWQAISYPVSVPGGATHARVSLRGRDRSDDGDPADPPLVFYLDSVQVAGADLANGDFEQGELTLASFGEDQGPFGWVLRSVEDQGLVIAEPTAAGQGAAFVFTQLDEGFGDNTVEQCFAIDAFDQFNFAASIWPAETDPDLRVRLNFDLHANEQDCLARANRIDRFDTDFLTSDMTMGEWNLRFSETIIRPANADWARIALRARDRRDPIPRGVSSGGLVLFDQVQPWRLLPPELSPPGQAAGTQPLQVTLTSPIAGAELIYTTDGSDPAPGNGTTVASGSSIILSEDTTLRVAAFRAGWVPSEIVSGFYGFSEPVVVPTLSRMGMLLLALALLLLAGLSVSSRVLGHRH